ncbi:MAG: enoyl-CoA hydratase-related protein [Planctomycetota bacterium]
MTENSTYPNCENLTVERRDRVLLVEIARPKVLNALSRETLIEIGAVFSAFASDKSVGAAVLTGGETGKKPAFAAGADIAQMSEMSGSELRAYSRLGQEAFGRIESAPKPVIAAIDGFALGGGLELAMACDMRFASESAILGQPEVNLGIIPGFAGTQRLPRLVGKARAIEMLLSGENIDAARALDIGLVDRVFAADELIEKTLAMAAKFADKAPIAVELILDAVHRGFDGPLAEAQGMESDLFGVVGATDDVKEGLKAFLERRKPEFKGR